MFPRSLTFFRFAPAVMAAGALKLQDALSQHQLAPVGPLEMSRAGWVEPMGEGGLLVATIGDSHWITLGTEAKVLPAAAVNAAVSRRVAEIEDAEGRKLGGRARKKLKDEVLHELLPRALVKPGRVSAFIFADLGLLAVDTASRRTAEAVAGELRDALGSFPAVLVNADIAPRSVLTGMLRGDLARDDLELGDLAVLQDPVDRGAQVRLQRQELHSEEVHAHLEAGKQCARLGVVIEESIGCTLCDDLVVRQFILLDGAVERLEQSERDSARAELDARFALLDGELRRLWPILEALFALRKAEG